MMNTYYLITKNIMTNTFELLRSKQSEDVSALSIVQNKNSSAIEFAILELSKQLQTISTNVEQLSENVKFSNNLQIDLSIFAIPQQINEVFSITLSEVLTSSETKYQMYVTRLDDEPFDFTNKIYQLQYDELIVDANFIRLTSNSATINFTLPNLAVIQPLNLLIHN